MCDDAEEDGEDEGEGPENDGVRGLEEELECGEIVLEAFLLEATRDLEPGLDQEDADAADTTDR
jgi:hypothetical protein